MIKKNKNFKFYNLLILYLLRTFFITHIFITHHAHVAMILEAHSALTIKLFLNMKNANPVQKLFIIKDTYF